MEKLKERNRRERAKRRGRNKMREAQIKRKRDRDGQNDGCKACHFNLYHFINSVIICYKKKTNREVITPSLKTLVNNQKSYHCGKIQGQSCLFENRYLSLIHTRVQKKIERYLINFYFETFSLPLSAACGKTCCHQNECCGTRETEKFNTHPF